MDNIENNQEENSLQSSVSAESDSAESAQESPRSPLSSAESAIMAELEALLFIYGEPIDIKKLAKILGATEPEIKEGIIMLEEELKREERGLTLIQDKNRIQLATKSVFAKLLENVTKQEFTEQLTPAALETLTIIVYAGPISRANIEYIRGVNSSFTIRALLMRGLVERELKGNAYIYSISFELLRHLGLSKNGDLPEYKKYKDLVLQLQQELDKKDKSDNRVEEVNGIKGEQLGSQ